MSTDLFSIWILCGNFQDWHMKTQMTAQPIQAKNYTHKMRINLIPLIGCVCIVWLFAFLLALDHPSIWSHRSHNSSSMSVHVIDCTQFAGVRNILLLWETSQSLESLPNMGDNTMRTRIAFVYICSAISYSVFGASLINTHLLLSRQHWFYSCGILARHGCWFAPHDFLSYIKADSSSFVTSLLTRLLRPEGLHAFGPRTYPDPLVR